MSFHGYWFNKFKQVYVTNKYPHCYIGIKQKLDGQPFWGNYSKLFKKGVYWGDYTGGTIVEHVVTPSNSTRDTRGNKWDVYVENDWHVIDPSAVRTNIGKMCDASFNLIEPSNVALTLFYKAVMPAYAFDGSVGYNALTYNGTYNGVSSLINGAYIGTPGAKGDSGNNNRYSILSVSEQLIENIPAYQLPSNEMLNRTSMNINDFPDGNNILYYEMHQTHQFNFGTSTVQEVDGKVVFTKSFEFLGINNSGGSDPKMITFAYDSVPTANVKATLLSYNVNHHLELFNTPSLNEDIPETPIVYMMPELFKPFMMIMPNTGGNSANGQMALYCVFGVKAI